MPFISIKNEPRSVRGQTDLFLVETNEQLNIGLGGRGRSHIPIFGFLYPRVCRRKQHHRQREEHGSYTGSNNVEQVGQQGDEGRRRMAKDEGLHRSSRARADRPAS